MNMSGGFDGSNIYRCDPDYPPNHGVVIVGYDDAGGYWIVKNSWGTGWPWPGAGGYFKVGYGECVIENYVSYAVPGAPPGQYELTMQVSPPGGGTTSPSVGDHWYDSDTSVDVSASANSGFDFDRWGGDCSGTSPATSVYMDSNKTCAANFCHEGCLCYPSSDTPVAIPDPGTVNSSINVPDGLTIDDVNLTLDITHTYDADLDVYLISPQGTRVELFTDVGGSGANFTNTTLDDDCATAITDGSAPFTGCYQPEGSLSDFDGENSSGVWTLELSDDYLADAGTLQSWSLEVCAADQDGDGVPDDIDNCPDDPNPGQEDTDGDGVPGSQPPPGATWGGDACDDDDDNDTVLDGEDADPLDEFACQDLDADTCDDCSVLGQPDPSQDGTDTDSDGACDAGDPDDDNDDFDDPVESYLSTDPLDDCPDDPSDDAWPFDINVDTWSNILDMLLYKGHLQTQVGDPDYDQRLDLNADTWVDILDILLYKGNIQVQCTNP